MKSPLVIILVAVVLVAVGTLAVVNNACTRGVSQLYLSLSDPMPNGNLAVRLYFKPHVLLIWLGAAIMFTGGALSISDRRLRVGAPQPARAKAASALQPAE
jgi:cytochrome c-type biogenesis protein CcmF